MKISLNWLNEFVDLSGIDIKEIVSRFSLSTAEIEGYEIKGKQNSGVVVGEIKTCERHPESKKPLFVLTVDNGTKVVPVVCGAPNCRVGLKVAFAKVGAKLGEIEVGKASLAGRESHGMCLSARELGLSNNHDEIIELDTKAIVGSEITKYIPEMVDIILEIENKTITNRPDLWGHYGIAREMAAIFGKKLKPLSVTDLTKFDALPKVPIVIENKTDCLSYGAVRVDNITLRNAPLFMQTRLFYCGINPHNFLVDLTNYIMLETSQPNHAFDASKVGKISIGNVPEASEFTTLKDQTIKTTANMLFIKSDGKPVALAGVMGGKNSEIDDSTKDCVFEFATFDATCVRKTANALSIRTDASNRYEKSLDKNLNAVAAARTVKLIETYDKKAKVVSNFNHVQSAGAKTINLTVEKEYLERFCGLKFDYKKVESNLKGLGFEPKVTDKDISVTVPTWRATKDITCAADVIEEIVRMYGYDNIQPVAPVVELKPVAELPDAKLNARLKGLLADKYGCFEVHTYVWNDTRLNKQLGIETPSHIRVINSCVKENDAVRSELAPSLLGVVSKNKQPGGFGIFEVGRVCSGLGKDTRAVEERHLAIAVSSKTESGAVLYKKLANCLRDIFELSGYKIKFDLSKAKQNYLHPKNNAVVLVDGKVVGFVGIVHPSVGDKIEAKTAFAAAEVNLTAFDGIKAGEKQLQRISKYQKSTLDFTFITSKTYGEVEAVFEGFKHPLNMGFQLKDIFEETDGRISYTLTFTVGSYEKTLTQAEIESIWSAVIAHGKASGLVLKA